MSLSVNFVGNRTLHEQVWHIAAQRLVAQTGRFLAAPVFAGVVKIDGLLAELFHQILEGGFAGAAEEQVAVAVVEDGIHIVLVNGLELALGLQNDGRGDLPAADGGDQLLKLRNFADVGELVKQAADMYREPAAVFIVGLVTQKIEKLGIHQRNQKIKGAVRIRNNDEQGGLGIAQRVQLHFVVRRDLPDFRNIKWR